MPTAWITTASTHVEAIVSPLIAGCHQDDEQIRDGDVAVCDAWIVGTLVDDPVRTTSGSWASREVRYSSRIVL